MESAEGKHFFSGYDRVRTTSVIRPLIGKLLEVSCEINISPSDPEVMQFGFSEGDIGLATPDGSYTTACGESWLAGFKTNSYVSSNRSPEGKWESRKTKYYFVVNPKISEFLLMFRMISVANGMIE